MRLGVDIGVLGPSMSGVSRYVWGMLSGMLRVLSDLDILLYSHRPVDVPLGPGNWRLYVDRGPCDGHHGVWAQVRWPKLLARDRVDAVWCQNYSLPLKLRRPCLRVLTVHDLTPVLLPWTMRARQRLLSRLTILQAVSAADLVVADSAATAALLDSVLGVTRDRVRVIHPGRDATCARLDDSVAAEVVMRTCGLHPGYAIMVATVEPRKGHLDLLRAWEMLADAPLLVLVGSPGWKSRAIRDQIAQMQARGMVRNLGWVDDGLKSALYSAAKLSVYPSLYEGFGLPVLEAMGCGCPVLCSWSSSLPEVGGQAAAYFSPRDSAALARVLRDTLHDPARLARMARLGLDQAERFSYDTSATMLLSELHSLTRTHRPHYSTRPADVMSVVVNR